VSLPAGDAAPRSDLPRVRPVYAKDLEELCKIDVAAIRRSLESRSKDSKTTVALLPDLETIQWHHARENFVGQELRGEEPMVKGAIVGEEKGKRVWCYWTRMWYNQNRYEAKGNTFHILRLVIEDGGSGEDSYEAAIVALLDFAQREAEHWRMEHVEMWTPSSTTLAAAKKLDPSAKVTDRDMESIACLQWFPEHDGPVADKIEWVGNEKYGWC
jgi:hypothetical protein